MSELNISVWSSDRLDNKINNFIILIEIFQRKRHRTVAPQTFVISILIYLHWWIWIARGFWIPQLCILTNRIHIGQTISLSVWSMRSCECRVVGRRWILEQRFSVLLLGEKDRSTSYFATMTLAGYHDNSHSKSKVDPSKIARLSAVSIRPSFCNLLLLIVNYKSL